MNELASVLLASSRSIVDIDGTVFVQALLFILSFFLLRSLVFKPLLRLIDERRAQTEGMRAEARRLESDAEARSKQVVRQVQDAKVETGAERERLRVLAKKREQEILRAAKDEAAKLAEEARRRVEAERAEAEREVATKARDLAGTIASRLAGRPLS